MANQNSNTKQPQKKKRSLVSKEVRNFYKFLGKHSVIGLAVGLVIGQATKDTVNVIVEGFITPLISLVVPQRDLSNYVWRVQDVQFQVGQLIEVTIEMVIIMLLLYFIVMHVFRRGSWIGLEGKSNSSAKGSK